MVKLFTQLMFSQACQLVRHTHLKLIANVVTVLSKTTQLLTCFTLHFTTLSVNTLLRLVLFNEEGFLRFDFTHFEAVTADELRQIEEEVNQQIWNAIPVKTVETDIDTAKSMGAMALFGEKYGKNVRVVTIGDYSIELCGGTHVSNTAEIGIFKIVKEEGIGSGTRRILAVTGKEAFEAYRQEERGP